MVKNISNKKLQKFFISFHNRAGELLQYEISSRKGEGLEKIVIPFDTNVMLIDDIEMKFFDSDARNTTISDYNFLKYALGEDGVENPQYYEDLVKDDRVLSGLAIGEEGLVENYFEVKKDAKFPHLKYSDVTEKDMFGYSAIPSSDLESEDKGLWGYHGLRKFEFELENFAENMENADFNIKVGFFWYEIDNKKIDNLFEEEVRYNKETKKITVYVNTNKLGEAIAAEEIESKHPTFRGRFEVHMFYSTVKLVYSFPVKLCVADTRIDEDGLNDYVKEEVVSIDFGTSSTCAAIRYMDGARLFTLSGSEKYTETRKNPFENPTNVMIYNWEEVYRQWESNNTNCPFFLTKTEELEELKADYDSGYTVEEEYKNADDENGMRKIRAILTQIKMLPYYLAKGEERKFTPYKSDSPIYVVTGEEDGLHFNPIAFYGYLLSRAINNPANGNIYKNYQITFPAKFNNEVKEQILAALTMGIKRALPKTVRDAECFGASVVSVTMDYSEPEACVGAVLGSQLRLDGEKAKLFGVYDLGGGTMDFAFGMLRNPNEDEEDDGWDAMVSFVGIDGVETTGGEKLIHQLAYKIYKDSRDEVVDKKIKFILPDGEKNPFGFDGLVSDRREEISEANLNIIKELLARPLFEYSGELGSDDDVDKALLNDGGKVQKGNSRAAYIVELENPDHEFEEVTMTVDGVADFLKQQIEETVVQFGDLMCKYFTKPEVKEQLGEYYDFDNFSPKNVTIFLGGNASKQYYVEELMRSEAYFGQDQIIERIGAGQNDDELSEEYRVNEKTAVAMGQLNFGGIFGVDKSLIQLDGGEPGFQFTIGYKDRDGVFQTVIEKNDTDKGWRAANSINKINKTTDLYYCAISTTDIKEMKYLQRPVGKFWQEKLNKLYLRINKENKVEFRLGRVKEGPQDSEPVNEDMIIVLSE